jgi:hypothetical protein
MPVFLELLQPRGDMAFPHALNKWTAHVFASIHLSENTEVEIGRNNDIISSA